MDTKCMPGAFIERGEIKAAGVNGYTIRSLDRLGIQAREIRAIRTAGDTTYTVGDRVYFFLFRDGTGMILGGME